jgi:hypothetical protein
MVIFLCFLIVTLFTIKVTIIPLSTTLVNSQEDTDSFRESKADTKGLTYTRGLACIENEDGEYEMVAQKKNCGIGLILKD